MKAGKLLVLALTHVAAAACGLAAGIYVLPILTAPPAPSSAEMRSAVAAAEFKSRFRKDLKGSDFLHWGEGDVAIGRKTISFSGKLAPGPDYKLYLSPEFVDSKQAFLAAKARSVRIADVKTFESFVVPVPDSVDILRYDTVVVWCETFSMFITAARYR